MSNCNICGGEIHGPVHICRQPSSLAPATGSVARWNSCARWPEEPGLDHVTTDGHETKEAAEAVCRRLAHEGLGGEGRIFPTAVWVEEIKPQNNQAEP